MTEEEYETTIILKNHVRDRLKNIGMKTETYSDVIDRLLRFYEEKHEEPEA